MLLEVLKGLVEEAIKGNDLDKQAIISTVYQAVCDEYGEESADIMVEAVGKIEEALQNGRIRNGIDTNDGCPRTLERTIRRGSCGMVVGETIGKEDNRVDAIEGVDSLHGHDSGSCNAADESGSVRIENLDESRPRDNGEGLSKEDRGDSNVDNEYGNRSSEIITEYERRAITVPREPKRYH